MKLNGDKCHLLLSGYKHEVMWANTGQSQIRESKEQKLLGVTIDRDMKFDEYILIQCKKAGRKLCALGRVCKFLNLERRRSLMKAFIESQLAYCPLLWLFCSRHSNNRINHLHERALRIVYNDHSSIFEDLLVKDNSVSIHHRNIRLLAIELYKAKNNLSSQLMLNLFQRREVNYNIRSQTDFSLRSVNTSSYGSRSLRYLATRIWNLVPQDIQPAKSLSQFIRKIMSLILDGYPCILCRTYIGQVG